MRLFRFQWQIFALALVLPALFYSYRIVRILPLYTSGTTREEVRLALTAVTAKQGWVLSDVIITGVSSSEVEVLHREHGGGRDPRTCYTLTLKDLSLHPCDAKLN